MMKKSVILTLLAAASLLAFPRPAGSQWVQTGGPATDWVSALAVAGDKVFAGTGEGVFVLSAKGTAWTPANNGLSCPDVRCLATVGTALFAGTDWLKMAPWLAETMKGYIGGVFRSKDGGLTWEKANAGLPVHTDVQSFAVIGKTLFVGADVFIDAEEDIEADGGIFGSGDEGRSWIDTGAMSTNFLAAAGTKLFAETLLDGFIRSEDNGKTWQPVGKGLPAGAVVLCLAGSGSNLVIGTAKGLFVSTDGGGGWKAVSAGLPPGAPVRRLASGGKRVFAATPHAVFISEDAGQSWTEAGSGLPGDAEIWSLAATGTDLFAGTEGKGVWRLSLSGAAGTKR
jgi:hypothetical protein